MIVLDSSAVVELLLNRPIGAAVVQRVRGEDVQAPQLLLVEVASVLRRLTLCGELDADRGADALADLRDLDPQLHDHEFLMPAIWRMRDTVTAYDAAYVALAEALDAPLVTLDRRLADAPGVGARVEVLGAEHDPG